MPKCDDLQRKNHQSESKFGPPGGKELHMFGIVTMTLLSVAGWRWGHDSRTHGDAVPQPGVAPRDW